MRTEAIMDDRKDTAFRLLKKGGISIEEVAEVSKLSIDEVQASGTKKKS